jgi:16S rRNA G966 N2-methylase RsmD
MNRGHATPGLTWVGGDRPVGELDETSGKILAAGSSGTSIFDPVLAELCYRWFCPPGGTILDPFAGGSVRGIVASALGRPYVGIDLSARQIAANREQADRICREPRPVWIEGDSRHVRRLAQGTDADFLFGCPPYADLERYSDDSADLSTLSYEEFRAAYRAIIAEACTMLKDDRFACFVVGDVRDAKGLYYGFPWHTVEAFTDAGLRLYNEAVLVTAAGSLALRAGKQFEASRKLGKSHQNVLMFIKGDPKRATQAIGKVEFADIEATEATDLPGGGTTTLVSQKDGEIGVCPPPTESA